MSSSNSTVLSTLNGLIEAGKDAENGFRTAAHSTASNALKALFNSYATQHAGYAAELQAEATRLGSATEKSGSVGNALQQGWARIKAAVTGGDDATLLASCADGEDAAEKTYQEALTHELPANVHAAVQRQLSGIHEARERLQALRLGDGVPA